MRYLSGLPLSSAFFILAAPGAALAADPTPTPGPLHVSSTPYKTYVNARFGYQVNYPSELLVPQGEADNSDGQKFLAKKGNAEMAVWGNYKVDEDLNDELKSAKSPSAKGEPKKEITYSAGGKDWFAVSGTIGDKIFYQKTCLRGDTFRTVTFSYPHSEKDKFGQVVDNVVATFKWCKK